MLKQARRLAKSEIANVRLVHGTGEQAVAELFGPASLEAVWINFSDPWPKKRHHRRRLVQPPLVAAIADRLVPGGLLHVATDDVPYAEHIDAVLAAEPRLENAFAPSRWLPEVEGRMPTAYELEWRAEGRPLHFFAYQRRRTEMRVAAPESPGPLDRVAARALRGDGDRAVARRAGRGLALRSRHRRSGPVDRPAGGAARALRGRNGIATRSSGISCNARPTAP